MRKTKIVTIESEGRDKGKQFLVTEMGAAQAEEWAVRAFLALAKSGIEIPDEAAAMGMAGIASVGIKALGGISWELAKPLLDEMFTCLQYHNGALNRVLLSDDIEEVFTRLQLRKEILELHLGFSLGGGPSVSPETNSTIPQVNIASPITKMFQG